MKIPKYIKDHITSNNRLLSQADKHAMIVLDWYDKQLKRLNSNISDIPNEDFSYIKSNYLGNGMISISTIEENLEFLERKESDSK